MMTPKHNLSRGLSLIETLVAISVLLIAITGPLVLAGRSITYTGTARDQLTAIYLAQDAIEYITAVKNYNIANGLPWLDGLASCNASNGCRIDTTAPISDPDVAACSASGCPALQYDAQKYQYGSGSDTRFTRIVRIKEVDDDSDTDVFPDERLIEVTLNFKENLLTKTFTLKTNVFNTNL